MAYRTDVQEPRPVAYATAYHSKHLKNGHIVYFDSAADRDRYDAAIERSDGAQRLDARQTMIKRDAEASKKPLGSHYFGEGK